MAGYSGTPLVQKLGIKPGHRVGLQSAPPGFRSILGALADGTTIRDDLAGADPYDVIVLFVRSRAELATEFRRAAARLRPNGGLWIGWPKRSSGVPTDMTEDVCREIGLPRGLVDNKVCAIDETWSGLRFVVRLQNRPKSAAPGKPRRARG